MPHLTTHVLDAARGAPATGVGVTLANIAPDGHATRVADGATDADGRLALGPELLASGVYALTFATGAYFAHRETPAFHPFVTVHITVDGSGSHLHVPLLLSPYSYTTYRGS
ncbi:MAG: hydroxyisourate hydrolase [Pseudoclavibacter sp.]